MTTYPENSLMALQAAVELGFSYIELDIQLSKDFEPIVIHDDNLKRTTGINKNVRDLTVDEIKSLSLYSSPQLKDQQELLYVPSLKWVVDLLNRYSEVTLFVEIKKQSIKHFELKTVVDQTIKVLKNARFNVVIISFIDKAIEYVQQQKIYPIGWVLKEYNEKYYSKANEIQPEYLFCNVKKINNNPSELWHGPWKWALYDIKNPMRVNELLREGVSLIETGDIVKLSGSDLFK